MKTTKGYSGPWNFYGVRYHNLLEFWGPWLQKLGSLLIEPTYLAATLASGPTQAYVLPLRRMITSNTESTAFLSSSFLPVCLMQTTLFFVILFFFYVAKDMSDKVTCFVVTWVNKATVIFFVSRYQWHGTYKWDHCRPGVVRVLKQSRENSK